MLELAEDEFNKFVKLWVSVLLSLSYCYCVGKLTSKGFPRFLAILPIIALFLALPLNLTSFHLGGTTAFFIAWLSNFKLLLFAFGKPPLSSSNISFLQFLALACLPIKIQIQNSSKQLLLDKTNPNQKSLKSVSPCPWNYVIKPLLLILIFRIYDYKHYIQPPKLIFVFYAFHIYFALEIILALLARSAKLFLGFELEPQFNEPLISSSLQDFWGRRWNIMATRILKPTVYLPALDLSTRVVGRKWAPLPAVMATFLVSAIMHELIFYYLGRLMPTFQVTCFFLLHGFCLCLEIMIKKVVGRKWRMPLWVSGPSTVAFVVATAFWLFMPPLVRAGLDTRPFQEYAAFGRFCKDNYSSLRFGKMFV